MKKNLYYRNFIGRENVIKTMILRIFDAIASYPRLLLEVFIRKDFGERYFKLSSSLTLAFLLALFPLLPKFVMKFAGLGNPSLMPAYLTWYPFLAAFVFFSLKHHKQWQESRSNFDFSRYTLCSGKIHPIFFTIQLTGRKTDVRLVETVLEPAPFFAAGLLLSLLQQSLGGLLIISSVIYSLSYVGAYYFGDNFVMDKIDEMICNEELEKSFVHDADEEETRGFRFRGRKPLDTDVRRKLLPMMMQEEEEIIAR